MNQAGKTQNEIAQAIGFSKGTISKELTRNCSKRGDRPSQADRRAAEKESQKRTRPKVMIGTLKDKDGNKIALRRHRMTIFSHF